MAVHYDLQRGSDLTPPDSVLEARRACILRATASQAYVVEKTGRNDHPQIYEYFRVAGFPNAKSWDWHGRAWCGVFVYWVAKECGCVLPKGNYAMVLTWQNLKSFRLLPGEIPKPADVVTYKPYSHVEYVNIWPPDPRKLFFYADGGNTGGSVKTQIMVLRRKADVKTVIRIVR